MAIKKLNAIEAENYGWRTRVYHGDFNREKNTLEYKEVLILENGNVIKRFKTEGKREYEEKNIELYYPTKKFKTQGLENSLIIGRKKND